MNDAIRTAARTYTHAGLSVLPVRRDDKKPVVSLLPSGKWEPLQKRIPSDVEAQHYFSNGANIAIIAGTVSGNLMVIDFDEARLYEAWRQNVGELANGVVVAKTHRGYHVFLRCPNPGGNQKLAWVPDLTEDSGRRVAIETRGEGGYVVVEPSIHASGHKYQVTEGSLTAIPQFSQAHADALLAAAGKLSEAPLTRQQQEAKAQHKLHPAGNDSVIQAYNTAHTIEATLESFGYTKHGERFIRPGGENTSVTIKAGKSFHHHGSDALGDGYWHDAFDVFCQLAYGGDFKAAVKDAAQALGLTPKPRPGTAQKPMPSGARKAPVAGDSRPRIVTNNRQLRDVSGDSEHALLAANEPPFVFVRGGNLARHRVDEKGTPLIEPLSESALRGYLARVATYISEKTNRDGDQITVSVNPPLEVVRDILAIGRWRFPPLAGIVETPVLRPDGTVLDTPGYDRATALYYVPADGLHIGNIPMHPTRQQIDAALAVIKKPFAQFPFTDEASRANTYGLLMTSILRPAIDGPVPLAMVNAPMQGSGKGLIVEVVSVTASGRPAPLTTLSKGEELRKAITAHLLGGSRIIVFDNVEGIVNSPTLAAALTSREWKDRVLGTSETPGLPQTAVWIMTGNNIQLGGDLPRRCYPINLDPKQSQPWLRRGFEIPNLEEWTRQTRGQLIASILTLARGWYDEGCPDGDAPILGSFPGWPRVVGGILKFAGVDGFLGNLSQMYEDADEEGAAWEAFLLAMAEKIGHDPHTVGEISQVLAADEMIRDLLPDIGEELLEGKKGEKEVRARFKKALGQVFRSRQGRRHGLTEARVERGKDHPHTKVARWTFAGTPKKSPQPICPENSNNIDVAGTAGTLYANSYDAYAREDESSQGGTLTDSPQSPQCVDNAVKIGVSLAGTFEESTATVSCANCGGTDFYQEGDQEACAYCGHVVV